MWSGRYPRELMMLGLAPNQRSTGELRNLVNQFYYAHPVRGVVNRIPNVTPHWASAVHPVMPWTHAHRIR